MNTQIEVSEETVAKLQAVAASLHLSLNDYLGKLAGLLAPLPTSEAEKHSKQTTSAREDVIGGIIGSEPNRPAVPKFGAYLVDKHHQEQRRLFALQRLAAHAGVSSMEWVREHFPDGRDSQGRRLAEFLDTLPDDATSAAS